MSYETVPGTDLKYYLIAFDSSGRERSDDPDGIMSRSACAAVAADRVTDVFVFSHGWLNDLPSARDSYGRWIGAMVACAGDLDRARQIRPGFQPLLVGLHWPSEPWGEEKLTADAVKFSISADGSAGVEAYAERLGDTPALRAALNTVFAVANSTVADATQLPPELRTAYEIIDRELGLGAGGVGAAPGDDREPFDADVMYKQAREDRPGGVSFSLLPSVDDLLAPLRALSFWKMMDRAQIFGESGAAQVLTGLQVAGADRGVRIHVMGHSFGCIVASAAVANAAQPVSSLVLVQGAFSLWSCCGDIPKRPGTPGHFRRILAERRVCGSIVTTQSHLDTAVGVWYPRGAGVAGRFAFAPGDLPLYGGVGTFGLQGPGVSPQNSTMLATEQNYGFAASGVYNLAADAYIRNSLSQFSGAHSDIVHPEVAHAVWAAALV